MQITVSLADWFLSSAAVYVLLREMTPVGYGSFLAAFLAAQAASLILPVPGGIGVFEAIMLVLRPSGMEAPAVMAALLAYRVVYYLLPLITAGIIYALLWFVEARESGNLSRQILEQLRDLASTIIAFITLLTGILLLASGAIPQDDQRLAWLSRVLPLAVIEASHLLGSMVGSMLIILAWGLERKSREAYHIVRSLFVLGMLLALGRSIDVRLALLMAALFIVLLLSGRAFPRSTSLVREPISASWSFAMGGIFILVAWLIAVLHRHTEVSGEVWWRFALSAQEPRALRAAVVAAAMILTFGLARMISRRLPAPDTRN
jgi:phosphatidylglycerol lysyltransferase